MRRRLFAFCSRDGVSQDYRVIAVIAVCLLVAVLPFTHAENKHRLNEEEAKTALIYNFMKSTQWPDEQSIAVFSIGLWGHQPALLNELQDTAPRFTVRGKKVKVLHIDKITQAKAVHVLLLSSSMNAQLETIASQLLKSSTLIITDDVDDKRYIMLNFIYPDKKRLAFEVNKSNIVYEGLKLSDEVLLYGGSEIDVAKLYKEMMLSLRTMRDQVEQQRAALATHRAQLQRHKKEIAKSTQQLQTSDDLLAERNAELRVSQQAIDKAIAQLQDNQAELSLGDVALEEKAYKLAGSEIKNVLLEKEIALNQSILNQQKSAIEAKNTQLQVQQDTVDSQGDTIATQKKLFVGILLLSFLLFALMMTVIKSRRQKMMFAKEREIFAAEAAMVEAQAESIKAFESNLILKQDFLATISHELRTPMNGIIGGIQLAKQDQGLAEQLDIIDRSAVELMGLINDILTYAEIQSQRFTIREEVLDLTAFFLQLQQNYQQLCEQKQLELRWQVSSDLPPYVQMDKDKLTAVISKLMDNAVKFTQHGVVTLCAEMRSTASLTELICSVRDTGIGIAEEDYDKIFEAFRQKDSSIRRGFSGLGIGLAICHEIVDAMGGVLTVESKSDKGSHFTVTLPIKATDLIEDKEQDHKEQLAVSADHLALPILVVEDNLVNQQVLVRMLQRLGYLSVIANNGQQALDLLKQQAVSLILMDLQMPVMDGLTCTHKIRSDDGAFSQLPIIAVTANLMDADQQSCLDAGMNDYIKKPVNMPQLAKMLAHYISPDNKQIA